MDYEIIKKYFTQEKDFLFPENFVIVLNAEYVNEEDKEKALDKLSRRFVITSLSETTKTIEVLLTFSSNNIVWPSEAFDESLKRKGLLKARAKIFTPERVWFDNGRYCGVKIVGDKEE